MKRFTCHQQGLWFTPGMEDVGFVFGRLDIVRFNEIMQRIAFVINFKPLYIEIYLNLYLS